MQMHFGLELISKKSPVNPTFPPVISYSLQFVLTTSNSALNLQSTESSLSNDPIAILIKSGSVNNELKIEQ